MSEQLPMMLRKTRWVGSALLIAIPLVWQLRETEMDPLNTIIMGGGLLLFFVTAIHEDWKYDRLNWIRRHTLFRLVVGGVIVFATAWIARGAYAPSLMDPESAKNKYVRVTPMTSSDLQSRCAVLVEFGVRHVNSEGFAVEIKPCGDSHKQWFGTPMRDIVQFEPGMTFGGPRNGTLFVDRADFQITPRTSYYVCVMGQTEADIEAKDILYFAIPGNATSLVLPEKERVGHQYEPIGWTPEK